MGVYTCSRGMDASGGSGGPSSDMKAFRELFSKAKRIVVLSGAGISAESGVPTFRYIYMYQTDNLFFEHAKLHYVKLQL